MILDLDGTVFPLPHRKVIPTPDRVSMTVSVPPWAPAEVAVRPAVVEAVKRWTATGAEVQWLTSWGWKTKWLDQVGLRMLPALYEPDPGEIFFWGRSRLSWKKPQVVELFEKQEAPFRVA